MPVRLATASATPDRPNEDFAAATTEAVVLLDGSGTPAGTESGCRHGVAWYARTLGALLLAEINPERALTESLGDAIGRVRDAHAHTCDLAHPATPAATVIAARKRDDRLDYLVLADSVLVLDVAGQPAPEVVTDDREGVIGRKLRAGMDATANGTPEHDNALRAYIESLSAHRNAPGGFWVAAADPAAAHESLTGSVPVDSLSSVALLSDGATRAVDRFGLATWGELVRTLWAGGPESVIDQVRQAEADDPQGKRWPRGKASDDATALHWTRPF